MFNVVAVERTIPSAGPTPTTEPREKSNIQIGKAKDGPENATRSSTFKDVWVIPTS
jgi:hypothetical protein